MFCLYFDASTGKVSALNGSGRSGADCTLDRIRESLGIPAGEKGAIPMSSVHAVTVPGAAAGWVDTVERFGSGKLSLEQILAPAIELGEKGFPVSELTAYFVCAPSFYIPDLSLTQPVATLRKVSSRCLAQLCRDAQTNPLGPTRPPRRRDHQTAQPSPHIPHPCNRGQTRLLRRPHR